MAGSECVCGSKEREGGRKEEIRRVSEAESEGGREGGREREHTDGQTDLTGRQMN